MRADSGQTLPQPRQRLDDVAWRIVSDALQPRVNLASFRGDSFQLLLELRVAEEARRQGLQVDALAEAVVRAVAELTGRRAEPDEGRD